MIQYYKCWQFDNYNNKNKEKEKEIENTGSEHTTM